MLYNNNDLTYKLDQNSLKNYKYCSVVLCHL